MVGRGIVAAAAACLGLVAPGTANASLQLAGVVGRPIAASATCSNSPVPAVDAPAATHRDFCVAFSLTGPEQVRDLTLSLPAGVIGDPTATPTCPRATFQAGGCTDGERVGDVSSDLTTQVLGLLPVPLTGVTGEIYNLTPTATEPARLGIQLDGGLAGLTPVRLESPVRVRAGDAGLSSVTTGIPDTVLAQSLHVDRMSLTLWGTKVDHPTLRKPFITLPTRCDTDATTTLAVTGYAQGTDSAGASFRPTACDQVPFTPRLETAPKQATADAPGEATATLVVPGEDTGTGAAARRQAYVRDVALHLPVGLEINPPLAAGLQPCTEEQFGFGIDATPQCPPSTEIGTVRFTTPLFGAPLTGKVYFGTPKPGQALRNFVSVEDPRLRLKLLGIGTVDPVTGQVTASFPDQPQVPFTRFEFTYTGGPHATLTAPATCGPKQVTADMTPWSGGPTVTPADAFDVVDCPAPAFVPTLAATLTSTAAGADTALTLQIRRPDRQLRLQRMTVSLPPGLTGRLTAVPACSRPDARAGTCAAASRVGSASVAVGTGPEPLQLPGTVYLTDGADGAVAGLAIAVDAALPALDLGRVVTLAQIRLREDGGIDVVSDDLPQRVQGFATAYRAIDLTIDRAGFLRNATGCDARAIHATFTAVGGATAAADAPYAATACDALPFGPRLSATLGGPGENAALGHPPLGVTIEQGAGEAAMRRTVVTLPRGIGVDLKNLGTLCSAEQLGAGACPAGARIGDVRAETPLLPGALTGGVYLMQPARKGGLPGIALDLGLLRLTGGVAFTPDGRLQTVFDGVPDVPLTRLVLRLAGGPKAPLSTTTALCGGDPSFAAQLTSHSGAAVTRDVAVKPDGCAPLTVTGELSGVAARRPTLRLALVSTSALRRVRVRLPARLAPASVRRLRTGARVLIGGARVRNAAVTVSGSGSHRWIAFALPAGRTGKMMDLAFPRGVLALRRMTAPGTKLLFEVQAAAADGTSRSAVATLAARR
jgi:hypothetical protein